MLQTGILYREHVLISVCDKAKYSQQNTVYSMLHACNRVISSARSFRALVAASRFRFRRLLRAWSCFGGGHFCYNRTIPTLSNTIP